MTHSCVTWLVYTRTCSVLTAADLINCDAIYMRRHDSVICETWLIHMWDMTHSYVRHNSLIYETRLIHMWDMTHWYVRHDSFICETWLMHMCAYEWQPFICAHVHESCLTYQWVMSHISMSHVSHINESCLIYQWVMLACDSKGLVLLPLCHARFGVMSLSHVTHEWVYKSYEYELYEIHVWHYSSTYNFYTHSCVRHDSFVHRSTLLWQRFLPMWGTFHSDVGCDSFALRGADSDGLVSLALSQFMCRHDSFVWETLLIHMRDIAHSYVRPDLCVHHSTRRCQRPACFSRVIASYMRGHDSFICETWSFIRETSLISIWDLMVFISGHGHLYLRPDGHWSFRSDGHLYLRPDGHFMCTRFTLFIYSFISETHLYIYVYTTVLGADSDGLVFLALCHARFSCQLYALFRQYCPLRLQVCMCVCVRVCRGCCSLSMCVCDLLIFFYHGLTRTSYTIGDGNIVAGRRVRRP